MIKTIGTKLEDILQGFKNIDWQGLERGIEAVFWKMSKADIGIKNKIIIAFAAMLTIILFGVFMSHGGKSEKLHEVSDSSLSQTLSSNKAEIQNSGNEEKSADTNWASAITNNYKIIYFFPDFGLRDIYKAKTIKVPGDFDSIQKAIDAARSGDVVLVSAGEYKENIMMKDGVSVIGEKAENTVLDGRKKGNVVTFKNISAKDARLENFTVKNSGENLSGVFIENSSPVINRNMMMQNDYDVYIKGESSPIVQRNILKESKAGIQIFNLNEPKNSNPVITDNFIYANKKGVSVYKGRANIEHNTISFNNFFGDDGSTFGIYLASAAAVIKNNIITDSGICEICSGVYADMDSKDVKISYNDIWNNQNNFVCFGKCEMEENNLSDDPLFENGPEYGFALKADSPFLASGSDGQKLGARL